MAAAESTATLFIYPSPLPSTLNSSPNSTRLAPSAPRSHLRPLRAAATLREVCYGRVPKLHPPSVPISQSMPVLLSGQDCIPTPSVKSVYTCVGVGCSGKMLAYLLAVFSAIDIGHSSLQALVIVLTWELGIQSATLTRLPVVLDLPPGNGDMELVPVTVSSTDLTAVDYGSSTSGNCLCKRGLRACISEKLLVHDGAFDSVAVRSAAYLYLSM